MTSEEKTEMLVRKEVVHNVTRLMQELMGQEKYLDDLSELLGEEDEDGNMPEVFE